MGERRVAAPPAPRRTTTATAENGLATASGVASDAFRPPSRRAEPRHLAAALYVPELNRLFINLSGGDKRDAQVGIQIYQVQP
jgi:hypothetical protein